MLNDRLNQLTDYPFDRLRALLDGLNPPEGAEPLVLSIGEPQHPVPKILSEQLNKNADLWGKYPPVDGTPEWRDAVQDWLKRRFSLENNDFQENINFLPAAGTREVLYMIASTVTPEKINGNKPLILIPNPFYQVYSGAAVMAGAEPVFLNCTRETGYLPDLDALDPATLKQTSLFYLCTPMNPQGAAASTAYLEKAIGLARQYDFLLASDECYSELYLDQPPAGCLEVAKKMSGTFNNVMTFESLSKRSNAAGLRSGFVAGDPNVIKAFRRLRTYSCASVPVPSMAASAALWADEVHVEENRKLYQAKFDAADDILKERFDYQRPDGGFFLWLNVGNGEDATRQLWEKAAIRVLPGEYLAREDAHGINPGKAYIRVALVHNLETTIKALKKIVEVLG